MNAFIVLILSFRTPGNRNCRSRWSPAYSRETDDLFPALHLCEGICVALDDRISPSRSSNKAPEALGCA